MRRIVEPCVHCGSRYLIHPCKSKDGRHEMVAITWADYFGKAAK